MQKIKVLLLKATQRVYWPEPCRKITLIFNILKGLGYFVIGAHNYLKGHLLTRWPPLLYPIFS